MQSAPGFLLHLRLFLEGIEIPVIGASVTASIGSPASANIDIIPGDMVDLLLPRTTVHLFYLDYVAFRDSGLSSPTDSFYKLLFAGELFSVSSSKVGVGSRSVTLSCMDFSNILDTSFIYTMTFSRSDNSTNSIVSNPSRFLATLDSEIDNIINSPSEVIRQLSQLSPTGAANQGQLTVLGGLLAIVERLLGIQGRTYGINPWTTIHERRARLSESIVSDTGETAAKVFEASQFSDWLKNRVGKEGEVISFRRLIDIVLEFIFYSFVPNPVAKYIAGVSTTKPGYPNRDVPEVSVPAEGSAPAEVSLTQFSRKASADLFGLQPAFAADVAAMLTVLDRNLRSGTPLLGGPAEVFITDAYRGSENVEARTMHQRGLAIDVRFRYLSEERLRAAKIIEGPESSALGGVRMPFLCHAAGKALKPVSSTASWYLRLRSALYILSTSGASPVTSIFELEGSILSSPSIFQSFYDGNRRLLTSDITVAQDWVVFGSLLSSACAGKLYCLPQFGGDRKIDPLFELLGLGNDPVHIQILGTPAEATEAIDTGRSISTAGAPRERLHSFVLRPDVWFSSPPRSNVIFPDMLQSFSAQREMIRETSRLKLSLGYDFRPDSAVTSTTYFAPQIEGSPSLSALGIDSVDSILIYDHEKYSGIVPKFDRMIDTIFYIKKDSGASSFAESEGTLDEYAPKVAHFSLLSERYKARTAAASLTFSPQIICGFPAVVLDQTVTSEEIGTGTDSLNKSFKVGLVESITHSISQAGAQTQIRLTHVRSHRSGDQTDDLFSNIVTNTGTLSVQEPSKADLISNEIVFVPSNLSKRLDGTAEFDFGLAAIAATFRKSTFKDILSDAIPFEVGISAGTPLTPLSVLDLISEDESVNVGPTTVSFQSVPYGRLQISSGTWVGGEAVIWIRTTTPTVERGVLRDTPDTQLLVGTTPPQGFDQFLSRGPVAFRTRFFIDDGVTQSSYLALKLPGSSLRASIPPSSVEGKILPVEESIRPVWVSDSYGNQKISQEIYKPFFGTTAIVDDVQDTKFLISSIEEAVDQIAIEYAKQLGGASPTRQADGIAQDPMTWIYDYTKREIATYPEILAQKDVRLDTNRAEFVRSPDAGTAELSDAAKYYGGFHSNAVNFGDPRYGGELEFLDIVGAGLQHMGHSGGEIPFEINKNEATRLDPRRERAERVKKYKANIGGDAALGVNSVTGIGKRG
jgi:hypothetical protein